MIKKRFVIDFDAARQEALTWVLASETRKTRYKKTSDASVVKVFNERYEHIEQEGEDLVPDKIIVSDDDAKTLRERWEEKMRYRLVKHEARDAKSLDPMTLWLIGEVIYFLITWWLDNRRKRIRRELDS